MESGQISQISTPEIAIIWVLPAVLLALGLTLLVELVLKICQIHALEKWVHNAEPNTEPKAELRQRNYAYQKALQSWSLLHLLVNGIILLLFLALRLPARLFGQIHLWFGGSWPMAQGIVFIGLLQLGNFVARLPWSLYRHFVIEEHFGFNRMQPKDFFLDALRMGLVSLVLGLPLLLGLFALMQAFRLWWLWGFLAVAGYQIVLVWLYPIWIAPLFNRFRPLAEEGKQGQIKQRLEELLAQCQFTAKGLFVMDGSKRSGHSNAYFTGFGKSRRIVLFDTLIEKLEPEPLAAVLAHEIGHYKKQHILKQMLSGGCVLFLGFVGLYWLSQSQTVLLGFTGFAGFANLRGLAGFAENPGWLLFVAAVLAMPLNLIGQYISNRFSRKHEFEADAYAASLMEQGGQGRQHLAAALKALHRENLSHPAPHPGYAALYYSHPSLKERLAALE